MGDANSSACDPVIRSASCLPLLKPADQPWTEFLQTSSSVGQGNSAAARVSNCNISSSAPSEQLQPQLSTERAAGEDACCVVTSILTCGGWGVRSSAASAAASGEIGGGTVGCVFEARFFFSATAPSSDQVWVGAVNDVVSVVPGCRRPS